MSTILHISDTHFGTEQDHVIEALVRLAAAENPEVVVVSGDLTQRARSAQFAQAAKFLERLRAAHVLVIPGNHDIPLFNLPARLFAPYGGYQRAFGPDLEPEHESEHFLILCVNTTRAARHIDGEVSAQQIERVAKRLTAASPLQLRAVVTHQPVHVVTEVDRKNLLHGYREAVRSWSAAGADVVMGGHIHLPYVRLLNDELADLPRRTWSIQAGTAVSSRVRHRTGNSLNLLRYDARAQPRGCVVEQWDYKSDADRFELTKCTEAALSAGV